MMRPPIDDRHDTADAETGDAGVPFDFDELRAEGVGGVFASVGVGVHGAGVPFTVGGGYFGGAGGSVRTAYRSMAGWVLMWTLPSDMARESAVLPWKGEDSDWIAVVMAVLMALSVASAMAGRTVAVAVLPPEVGPGVRLLSPRMTRTRLTGMPVRSLTTWAKTV